MAPRPLPLLLGLCWGLGCADPPCPAGSARAEDGLCTLPPEDSAAPTDLGDCARDTGRFEDPAAIDASLSWSGWADGFFATYCRSCHSASTPDRRGAPEGVDFDHEAEVGAQVARVRARVLEQGDMPAGGGVVQDDLWLLDRYLCRLEARR
jgi:hypothetical protein